MKKFPSKNRTIRGVALLGGALLGGLTVWSLFDCMYIYTVSRTLLAKLITSVLFDPLTKILLSSANSTNFPNISEQFVISLMYIRKRRGPSTLPCVFRLESRGFQAFQTSEAFHTSVVKNWKVPTSEAFQHSCHTAIQMKGALHFPSLCPSFLRLPLKWRAV